MDVSKNRATPKWMVKIMENPIKMDDLGGFPIIFGNTQMKLWKMMFIFKRRDFCCLVPWFDL